MYTEISSSNEGCRTSGLEPDTESQRPSLPRQVKRQKKVEPTKVCVACTESRLQVVKCSSHDMQPVNVELDDGIEVPASRWSICATVAHMCQCAPRGFSTRVSWNARVSKSLSDRFA